MQEVVGVHQQKEKDRSKSVTYTVNGDSGFKVMSIKIPSLIKYESHLLQANSKWTIIG